MIPQKYSPAYYELNSGAHRKSSNPIGIPSLVRHIAYWIPCIKDNTLENRKAWIEYIDNRLYRVFRKLKYCCKNTDIKTNVDDEERIFLFSKVYSIHQGCSDNDNPIDHSKLLNGPDDYKIILFNFKWRGVYATIKTELHIEFFTLSLALDLSTDSGDIADFEPFSTKKGVYINIKDEINKINSIANGKDNNFNLQFMHSVVYQDIWDKFYEEVLCPFISHGNDADQLGLIFADFRVLLTSPDFEETNQDDGEINSREALFIINNIWPFLKMEQPTSNVRQYAFTACRMCDNQMLYATAMGQQPYNKSENVPLFAFHYWKTRNCWEISRMIDLLNYAGTTRLASLMDIGNLKRYSNDLRYLQSEIDNIRENITKDGFLEAQNRFNIIDKENNIHGGAGYRIDRARFYIKRFKHAINAMRIDRGRVNGYQPYDEFVFHRLGVTFDFIDRLGIRYEKAKKDLANLSQLYLTKTSIQIQENIEKRNEGIEKLQEKGEMALFGALLPYYLATIISHMMHLSDKLNGYIYLFFLAFGIFYVTFTYNKIIWIKYILLLIEAGASFYTFSYVSDNLH